MAYHIKNPKSRKEIARLLKVQLHKTISKGWETRRARQGKK